MGFLFCLMVALVSACTVAGAGSVALPNSAVDPVKEAAGSRGGCVQSVLIALNAARMQAFEQQRNCKQRSVGHVHLIPNVDVRAKRIKHERLAVLNYQVNGEFRAASKFQRRDFGDYRNGCGDTQHSQKEAAAHLALASCEVVPNAKLAVAVRTEQHRHNLTALTGLSNLRQTLERGFPPKRSV